MAKNDHAWLAVDFNQRKCWRFKPSPRWLKQNPCDCPVSIGFIVGEHIAANQLSAFIRQGNAWEVDFKLEYETPKQW